MVQPDNNGHAEISVFDSFWLHALITILVFVGLYATLPTLVRACSAPYGSIPRDPIVYSDLIMSTDDQGCGAATVVLSILLAGILSLAISINKKYFAIVAGIGAVTSLCGFSLLIFMTGGGRLTLTELGSVEFEGRLYYLLYSEKERPDYCCPSTTLHLYQCYLDGTNCYDRRLSYFSDEQDFTISVAAATGTLEVRNFDEIIYSLSPERTALPTLFSNLAVITEDNAKSLRELVRIGSGRMFDLAWSSDSKVLAGSNEGLWLFRFGDDDVSMFHDPFLRRLTWLDFVREGQSTSELESYVRAFLPLGPVEGTTDTLISYWSETAIHPTNGLVALYEFDSRSVKPPIHVINVHSETDFPIAFTESFTTTGDMAFSSDGTLLYFTGAYEFRYNTYLYGWDTTEQQLVFTVNLPEDTNRTSFTALSVSPDDKIIATASTYGIVQLWASGTGAKIAEFEGLERIPVRVGSLRAVAFSPDGRLLATSGGDDTVRLWGVVEK